MKRSNTIIRLVVLFFLFSSLAFANDANDVESYLKTNLDSVFSVLKNDKLPADEKTANIVDTVSPMFDFERITMLSFGRKHWTGMNADQQKQFVNLFVKLLKKSFIEKLTLYTNEKVQINPPVINKNKAEIPTVIISENEKYSVNYKFYKSKELGWKIWDLEIQDVSIVRSYQTQIDEILQKGTYEDLLTKLDKPE